MESKQKSLARSEITAHIADVCEQIARWRETRRHRERMPEQLWAKAVSLARLDYYALKDRLGTPVESAARRERQASFLEFPVSLCAATAECTIEMEHPRGSRMRIQVKGGSAPDLPALSRSFWSRES
jgi:hypothetical protein